ncbi:hypothetical protein MBLNU459_g6648t2 [Dothideomycetes sp. NU459]
MDAVDLHPLVDDLSVNIDDLEESLAPLLNTALSASTSKLPLLDKAKLYVLATYAIESLLFSYLKLNGVDAKEHPVFLELTRVKEYFGKIKVAESAPVKRNTALDKAAAGRFVKHALSGNEEYDKKRAEQAQREKAGAKRKFEDMTERVGSHLRFENMSSKLAAEETEGSARETDNDPEGEGADEETAPASRKSKSKSKSRAVPDTNDETMHKSKKKRSKLDAADAASENNETVLPTKRQKSSKAPKAANEAFQALLQGPLPKQEESRKKKKRKSHG